MYSLGTAAPNTPLGLLRACHARIRTALRRALTVGVRPDLSTDEIVSTVTECTAYFREVFPLHVADEEESLWPLLVDQAGALDATLAQLRAQHLQHRLPVEALLDALDAVRAHPRHPNLHRALATIAATLETDLTAHLCLEEQVLFPAVERALSDRAQATLLDEMRARRRPRNIHPEKQP